MRESFPRPTDSSQYSQGGWSDITPEPEAKDAILRLIQQLAYTGTSTLGILKHGRIGGALLYGSPGTGETLLTCVFAREAKAVTINVSVANIRSSYVGKAKKAVKGLFNLEKMLSPCTVFLDEADSLFRHRTSKDET